MNKVLNILLVEDDPLDQRQIERAFEKKGILHRMQIARNGEEALCFLMSESEKGSVLPDIILLDLSMPKMNGLEFLNEFRKYEQLSGIKVFVLTGSDQEKPIAEKLNVSGYILKPLRLASPATDSIPLMIDMMNIQSRFGK
jgi:CheY-like chemotaxis protein